MTTPPFAYGDDLYESRSELRAAVWEISGGRCEHPVTTRAGVPAPCDAPAAELAHIVPRGMGHTGYRDTVNNCIAACNVHARSTDNRADPAWQSVPPPHDRQALAEWVRARRRATGWAV